MSLLGNGLSDASHDEDALSVREAELSMAQRLGAPVEHILAVQANLANSYQMLGRPEALRMRRDVYSMRLKVSGEEHRETLLGANNYASLLKQLKRFEETKSLMRKSIPIARRVLGEGHDLTLTMRRIYAGALYKDASATLDDLREAVTTLEEAARTARRVLGGSHPTTAGLERVLEDSRAALRAREAPPSSSGGA
jgi:hypothetical protein